MGIASGSRHNEWEGHNVERIKTIFYSFLILLALGGILYYLRNADFGDTIFLYCFAALAALVILVQSYSLVFDMFHHGVTAALNTTKKTTDVAEISEAQKVEKKQYPRWKTIISLFVVASVTGFFLYFYKPLRGDTFWLYAIGFFILMVCTFFYQTYRLIYDVFHRGVTAALIATDETPAVTEKSDLRRVEGNEMPTQPDGAGR